MHNAIHPVLRRAAYVFILVLIGSVAVVVVSDTYRADAYDKQQAEMRVMRLWKNKIDNSRESNKIIDEYESSFIQLVKNSVIGEENRLSWYETIQATANARGMSSVKYNVSSQKLLDDKTGMHKAQGLKVYRSKMTLDIKMSHEGDLFALFNNLESSAKGLFAVDRCDIEQLGDKVQGSTETMRAYCELSWFTFRSADEIGKL